MAEATLKDLNYGHLGEATYDLENHVWTFPRVPGRADIIRRVGPWQVTLPPAKYFEDAAQVGQGRSMRETQRAAKYLTYNEPLLAPSLDLLPELAQISAAAISIAATYDPFVGNLLAFGSVSTRAQKKQSFNRRSRKVAALPTGECGNILRIVALGKTRHGWGIDRRVSIEGPSISDEESGYWVDSAAPIQQICYSETDDGYPFLAVRLHQKVVLFRPSLHDLPVAAVQSTLYSLPPSRIEANPIAAITVEQAGGAPLADVTFNPEYQRQVGLVDQKGSWSVWDIEGSGRYEAPYSVSCTIRGTIADASDRTAASPTDDYQTRIEDGWARLLWAGDVNTIVVCDRRHLAILDIRSKPPMLLKSPDVVSPLSADWILDVRRHPKDRHHFFVLTSSRLLLLKITCLNEVTPVSAEDVGARIVFSWTHFRGPDDITLQLSITMAGGLTLLVMVHSRLNALVTVHRFGQDTLQQSLFSPSDPSLLTFENGVISAGPRQQINSMHVHEMRYDLGEERPHRHSGPGVDYVATGVSFFRLSVLLSDLSVSEALLYAITPDSTQKRPSPHSIECPTWEKTIRQRIGYATTADVDESDDDFVVADGMEESMVPQLKIHGREAIIHKPSTSSCSRRPPADYRGLYEILTYSAPARDQVQDASANDMDISDVVDRMEELLLQGDDSRDDQHGEDVQDAGARDNTLLETMFELADAKFTVADIDASSAKLENFITTANEANPIQLRRIARPEIINPAAQGSTEPTIASVYDTILQTWIAPLAPEIPARVRQTKERLARRVAAEVVLSGIRLRSTDVEDPHSVEASTQDKSTSTSGSFSVLPSSQPSSPWRSSPPTFSQPPSEIALPTPEPIPSIVSDAQGLTSDPALNPIGRLSQHLRFTKHAPTINPGIARVLKHWQLGTDPRSYNWEATTNALQEEPSEDEQLTEAEKEKKRRKAERHLKRQKREAEASQARELEPRRAVESQPVGGARDGGFRSSPPPRVGVGMSSQAQSQSQIPGFAGFPIMSQVEPGRHGGRPIKKRPKRMGGF